MRFVGVSAFQNLKCLSFFIQWALSYLIDNGPYDEYLYILTVYTGLHRHAGTKSNVNFLIIEGDPKTRKTVSSEIRILDDGTNQVSLILFEYWSCPCITVPQFLSLRFEI